MKQYILQAIEKEPDYSEAFTKKVDTLRKDLAVTLNIDLLHDTDMNYSVAQKLSHLTRDSNGKGYKMDIYISSRAPIFTVCWLKCVSNNEWSAIVGEQLPKSIQRLKEKVVVRLQEKGMKEIEADKLNELVPGAVTDMDGAPATFFDVLFSELH